LWQLAAALKLRLTPVMADKWTIHKGAFKLAHSKGFGAGKKYAALIVAPADLTAIC
jgi:hypothetical protein